MTRAVVTLVFSLIFALQSLSNAADDSKPNYSLKDGFVPTGDVAIKIAVAVWEPIYGAEKIAGEKPFTATLAKGIWTVQGSLPNGAPGGVAIAEISKADARILRVNHSQ